ncbi:unnamed protein product [Absidia cylindrospora]
MSIVAHNIEQDGTVKFIVTLSRHNFTENMTTRQILAAQPLQPQSYLQVYHRLYELPIATPRSKETLFPHKLETMLLDYIDVGHIQAAQEIIETCLCSGYYPSTMVVLVLMDTLLKRTKNKNKQQRKDKIEQHYRSHALLLHILKTFGPDVLAPLWTKIGLTHAGKKRRGQHQQRRNTRSTHRTASTTNQDPHRDEDDDDDDEDDDDDDENLNMACA